MFKMFNTSTPRDLKGDRAITPWTKDKPGDAFCTRTLCVELLLLTGLLPTGGEPANPHLSSALTGDVQLVRQRAPSLWEQNGRRLLKMKEQVRGLLRVLTLHAHQISAIRASDKMSEFCDHLRQHWAPDSALQTLVLRSPSRPNAHFRVACLETLHAQDKHVDRVYQVLKAIHKCRRKKKTLGLKCLNPFLVAPLAHPKRNRQFRDTRLMDCRGCLATGSGGLLQVGQQLFSAPVREAWWRSAK